MSHLFLIGFMGAGKSTVGRLVARAPRPALRRPRRRDRASARAATIPAIFAESRRGGVPLRRDATRCSALGDAPPTPSSPAAAASCCATRTARCCGALGRVVYLAVTRRGGARAHRRRARAGRCSRARRRAWRRRCSRRASALYAAVADVTVDTAGRHRRGGRGRGRARALRAGARAGESTVAVGAGRAPTTCVVGRGLLARARRARPRACCRAPRASRS